MADDLKTVEPVELDSGLFIPASMLLDYGCRHCVFKATERCPYGYKGEESHDLGYCEHIAGFLSALAEKGDTINNIKEKFQVEVQSQQALADFAEFKAMEKELKELRANGEFGPKVDSLEMRTMAYKTWWTRLSDTAAKGWGKINDRKMRDKSQDINVNHKIDLSQLHSLMNKAKEISATELSSSNIIEVDNNNDIERSEM